MLKLGQALHAVQDFYAHSNYVELMQAQTPAIPSQGDFPVVEIWTEVGRMQLANLATNGLVSGHVWWSFPKTCQTDSPTHWELAKDSPNSPAGKVYSRFTHPLTANAVSNYTVAYNLAARATRELLRWAGQRWLVLEKYCGKTLRYIVQPDRRAATCRVEGDASTCTRDRIVRTVNYKRSFADFSFLESARALTSHKLANRIQPNEAAACALTGRLDKAKELVQEILEERPEFSVKNLRDIRRGGFGEPQLEQRQEGLRRAGLPEK